MSQSMPMLAEGDIRLILAQIKSNIGTALAAVAAKWADSKVTLENPQDYYTYEKPQGFKLPAVWVIHRDMDFRVAEKKPNCINAKSDIVVSVMVEEKDQNLLAIKAFRYQQALHYVLDGASLLSSDQSLQLKVVVYHHTFSPVWSDQDKGGGVMFRKEVALECQVDHLENS